MATLVMTTSVDSGVAPGAVASSSSSSNNQTSMVSVARGAASKDMTISMDSAGIKASARTLMAVLMKTHTVISSKPTSPLSSSSNSSIERRLTRTARETSIPFTIRATTNKTSTRKQMNFSGRAASGRNEMPQGRTLSLASSKP